MLNDDDNYQEAMEGDEDEDDVDFKKPTSWSECLSMLWSLNEERLLMIQNPDGLLYLTFLKSAGLIFSIRK